MIYPNPAYGDAQVEKLSSSTQEEQIEITNSIGERVYHSVFMRNETSKVLHLSHLPKGLYSVRVSGEDHAVVRKLILQ